MSRIARATARGAALAVCFNVIASTGARVEEIWRTGFWTSSTITPVGTQKRCLFTLGVDAPAGPALTASTAASIATATNALITRDRVLLPAMTRRGAR